MAPKPQPPAPLSPQAFATTHLHLLSLEQATEVSETQLLLSNSAPTTLARAGLAILNLATASQRTGLGGRTVLELSLDPAIAGKDHTDLPEHGIRTGDIVRVSELVKGGAKKRDLEALKAKGVEGVVTRVGERAVWVAVGKDGNGSEEAEVPDGKLWLVKLTNDVTYKRMNTTLNKFLTPSPTFTYLTQLLFGLSSPPDPASTTSPIKYINPNLNDSQKAAIAHALSPSTPLTLIHGPPGTGKTSTLIEVILQLHLSKPIQRILVCGPSNISVDNIVERLASLPVTLPHPSTPTPKRPPFLRLGHPARLLPSVLSHSLDALLHTSPNTAILTSITADIDRALATLRKTRGAAARRAIYNELKDLRKEHRAREARCLTDLLSSTPVICSTLHGAGSSQLRNITFDVVIIDEASQALEAQCWIPLLMTGNPGPKKLILAGDHLQLPPTIKSIHDAKDKDKATSKKDLEALTSSLASLSLPDAEVTTAKQTTLSTTLFSRLLTLHGPTKIKILLTTQYRMHSAIMTFPSTELYDGSLIAAPAVAAHLLTDLPYEITPTDDTRAPLVFLDTQGGDFPERTDDPSTSADQKSKSPLPAESSKSNPSEAALAASHVRALLAAGVRESDIAVITPYSAQVALLRGLLRSRWPGVELGSVDGFQGREKECVVVSLVRSNSEGEVGFLEERRRLNVAMTRPKRHLCVIGDSETVSRGSAFLKRWMKFLEENAELRYPDVNDLQME